MIKRRTPTEQTITPDLARDISAFGDEATPSTTTKRELDPHAKRDFKAITVPFNEYEFNKLEEIAKKNGRTKLNLIRWAILQID